VVRLQGRRVFPETKDRRPLLLPELGTIVPPLEALLGLHQGGVVLPADLDLLAGRHNTGLVAYEYPSQLMAGNHIAGQRGWEAGFPPAAKE